MIPKQIIESGARLIKVRKKGKDAIEPDWNKTKNYSYDDSILKQHIEKGGNYGVKTGNGLIVIDADSTQLNHLLKKDFPKTFTIETSEDYKRHYYFYCIGLNNTKRLFKDGSKIGDLQSTGVYVVGANSIHPSGKKYKVVQDLPIAEINADFVNEKLGKFYASEKLKKEVILEGAEEGLRNESMFRLACSFKAKGLDIGEVLQTIKVLNEKNKPPLSENEINQIVKSTFSYEDKSENQKPNDIEIIDFMTFKELRNFKDTRDFLIENVIPESSVVMLFGQPASKKSLITTKIALCVAKGQDFLGLETKQGAVLICDMENGLLELRNRLNKIAEGMDIKEFDFPLYITETNIDLNNKLFRENIFKIIEDKNIKLIVFDTLNRFVSWDENSSSDVNKLYKEFFKPVKELGASVLFLHHTQKGKHEYRGSGDFLGNVDLSFYMQKYGEKNFTITNKKFRFGVEGQQISGETIFDDDCIEINLQEHPDIKIQIGKRCREFIIEELNKTDLPKKDLIEKIISYEGLEKSERTAEREIKKMLENGFLSNRTGCLHLEMKEEKVA